jgi:hypothetical protein
MLVAVVPTLRILTKVYYLIAARIFPRASKQQQQQPHQQHLFSDDERKKESCKKHIVPADVETLFITCKECNKQKSISQNGNTKTTTKLNFCTICHH